MRLKSGWVEVIFFSIIERSNYAFIWGEGNNIKEDREVIWVSGSKKSLVKTLCNKEINGRFGGLEKRLIEIAALCWMWALWLVTKVSVKIPTTFHLLINFLKGKFAVHVPRRILDWCISFYMKIMLLMWHKDPLQKSKIVAFYHWFSKCKTMEYLMER